MFVRSCMFSTRFVLPSSLTRSRIGALVGGGAPFRRNGAHHAVATLKQRSACSCTQLVEPSTSRWASSVLASFAWCHHCWVVSWKACFVRLAVPPAAAIAVVTVPGAGMTPSEFGSHRRRSTGPGHLTRSASAQVVFSSCMLTTCVANCSSHQSDGSLPPSVPPFKSHVSLPSDQRSRFPRHLRGHPAEMVL